MQASKSFVLLVLALSPTWTLANDNAANPLGKVIQLLGGLAAKIRDEASEEAKVHATKKQWCHDAIRDAGFDIEDSEKRVEKLSADIDQKTSDIEASTSTIEELAASLSDAEKKLADASKIREQESADFNAEEKELEETIGTISRASIVIAKATAKGSFAQVDTSTIKTMISSLTAIVDAVALPINDRQKLLALVQSKHSDNDEDDEFGAPEAAAYESHSGNILDVLDDLKEKAEGQLETLRRAEREAKHNFNMLEASLKDAIKNDSEHKTATETSRSAASQAKASAEGDLEKTSKALAETQDQLASDQQNCKTADADYAASKKASDEELAVVAKATKILQETSGGAAEQVGYNFAQDALRTEADLAGAEVVNVIKNLAEKQHSAALSQLASRITTVLRYGAVDGEDPFGKVKGLIKDLIGKLEKEAAAEATEKAWCDEQLAETTEKNDALAHTLEKLESKLDSKTSRQATLKEEVSILTQELSAIAKSQASADEIRREENTNFLKASKELNEGISGVQEATNVLKDYYGGSSDNAGAGLSIVNLLEVVVSDFSDDLAKKTVAEDDAASSYAKETQENKIATATKEMSAKTKEEQIKNLAVDITALNSDLANSNTEKGAVMEYLQNVRGRCTIKAETHEESAARRQAEISGLKEALNILNSSLLQKSKGSFLSRIAVH